MTRYSRSDWSARPGTPGPGRLDPQHVRGLALHWPGLAKPMRGDLNVMAALRSWQNMHMDTRGWSDLAYQETIDQDGNVYAGRGLRVQSGANGDEDTNQRFGAILLVIAPGEEPTEALIKALRRRIRRHRELFPRSTRIVGHCDIRPEPTACPGPAVTALIESGELE